jgi:metal-dependent amidase/aminoacylase/carboxypeptidase family protein
VTHFDGKKELSEDLATRIERNAGEVEAIAREIFDNPEPPLEEHRAAGLITAYLEGLGYEVETGIAGMPTAFVARMHNHDSEAMRKGLRHGRVAILAEYDAGPGGHMHGRHLMSGVALACAAGLPAVLEGIYGDISIIGCPAATTLEGKRRLADAGVFEEPDVVFGAAPASSGFGYQPTINNSGGTLGMARIVVRFAGGAGESDARQRLATAGESVQYDGGELDEIHVSLSETGVVFTLTSDTNPGLDQLIEHVVSLARAAALDTNSTEDITVETRVPATNVNRILARRVKTYVDNMGLVQDPIRKAAPGQPSDWAYPSMVVATVLSRFPVTDGDLVEVGTPEFAEATQSEFAFKQVIATALGIGITALDTLGDMDFRGFAEGELIRSLKAQGVSRTPRRWLGVHPVLPRTGQASQPPALGPLNRPRRS